MAEKFSRWRDPGTGIPPFLPAKKMRGPLDTTAQLVTWWKDYVNPLSSALKLCIIAVLGLVGGALDALGVILVVRPLRRLWTRLVSLVFIRASLFLLGFYHIKTSYISLKKGLREKQLLQKTGNTSKTISDGDIIVANHSSYIDILYLQMWYAPVFLHISSTGKVRRVSFREALFSCGEYPQLDDVDDVLTLRRVVADARKNNDGPVIVFPEGTTTNGRALLKFLPVFDDFDLKSCESRVHLFGFKFDFEDFAPTYTIGGKLNHVLGLGAQFSNTLEVRILAPEESALIPSDSFGSNVATALGQLTKLRMTGLSIADKKDFFDYWVQVSNKKKRN